MYIPDWAVLNIRVHVLFTPRSRIAGGQQPRDYATQGNERIVRSGPYMAQSQGHRPPSLCEDHNPTTIYA